MDTDQQLWAYKKYKHDHISIYYPRIALYQQHFETYPWIKVNQNPTSVWFWCHSITSYVLKLAPAISVKLHTFAKQTILLVNRTGRTALNLHYQFSMFIYLVQLLAAVRIWQYQLILSELKQLLKATIRNHHYAFIAQLLAVTVYSCRS
jgi:hypothetical protein